MCFTKKNIKILFAISIFIIIAGCATYYTRNFRFQEFLLAGDLEKANSYLVKNDKDSEGRNKLLYYLNRGYLSWMLQNNSESNQHFTIADHLIEDQVKNYGKEVLALITNPSIKPYRAEDFETVFVNIFKSLNYIQLGNYNDAIVECRRVNIKLNNLNDKFKDNKSKYQNDAFAHNMMGMVYEANGDYNNAFIAYRNALDVYDKDYTKYFNLKTPHQLKKDVLRTAYLTGFYNEVEYYEKQFNIKYAPGNKPESELIFLWLNGFGPVKSEWSIMFTVIKGEGGWVTLANEEYGFSFPYYIGNKSSDEQQGFGKLRFVRVAFPKYIERKPLFNSAKIISNQKEYKIELAEDINAIAFKSLNDRMLREIGTAVLRLASKKAIEALASKENEGLGTIVSIANALTEKADTRNWQTLPYSISYVRVPLKSGMNNIILKTSSQKTSGEEYSFNIKAEKNKVYFHTFHNLESLPLGY